MINLLYAGGAVALAIFLLAIGITAVLLRRVVTTNEVHIVQSRRATTSYGAHTLNGNVYYEWPSWLPVIGVTKIVLPISVFDLTLSSYEAYDKGRVPFVVDVVAFFRVSDSNMAAQRVESFEELHSQLKAIVQGAIRTVLASHEIDDIMLERSKFGEQFTKEVVEQLANWGVEPVKNIELMDIRDAQGSKVVHNIMAKKQSLIEMQSRSEVAENMKRAQTAEIDAKRDVDLRTQEARQQVGLRTVEAEREVHLANEKALQVVKEQQKVTQEREMAVKQVSEVRTAEIAKDVHIVKAEETKRVQIVEAEGQKQKTVTIAEGDLEAQKRAAEGIQVEGTARAKVIALEGNARAEAEKNMQLAPVQAQIVLAKEIGENQGYQQYLVTVRQVEAAQAVGVEQAKVLERADVKIIVNSGEAASGVTQVMDLFTAKGGTSIGAMLEALKQTEGGQALLKKVGVVNGAGEAHQ